MPARTTETTSTDPMELFLHDTADFYESRGIPRIAGRIFAYLLVSEPIEQTATQLGEAVGASRGSISGMTNLLLRAGLIERRFRRGQRQAAYSVAPDAFNRIVSSGLEPIRHARALADRGLALLAGRSPEVQARIRELRDVYAFFEHAFPQLLDEWERKQEGKES